MSAKFTWILASQALTLKMLTLKSSLRLGLWILFEDSGILLILFQLELQILFED